MAMPTMKSRGLVAVGDGRKALLLINTGTVLHPQLALKQVLEAGENPPTHEQGTDRPGRSFQSMGTMRSAVSQTDWHELTERRFAEKVVAAIQTIHQLQELRELMLVAPPRTLSYLRHAMPEQIKKMIALEIDKDLTNLPISEIQRNLTIV
ncbi:host attachment protein [Microvirga sp. 2TAF3]|uniref:host attachment protein n=1 Tax=Microvirga sp. 2TAF3 TaxID=3233014 RepID=UPI003F99C7AB